MITKKEKQILQELRKDSRQSFAKISAKLNIPVTTVFETHKKLNKTIIKKHTSIINFEKTGFPIRIMIVLNNNRETYNFLMQRTGINNLHKTKNELLADCIFSSLREKQEFLEQLNSIGVTPKIYDVVEQLKSESFETQTLNIQPE